MRRSKKQLPKIIPTPETLHACRAGLTRRINAATNDEKKYKLTVIREEIDSLIKQLG